MKILSKSQLNLSNSILIIDEAHNLQDLCCDSTSVEIKTNVLDEIIKDLKGLKLYFEDGEKYGKKDYYSEKIKPSYLANQISVLNTLKERIMSFKLENKNIKHGQNPGLKLDAKMFFDLLFKSYKGSQATITLFNIPNENQITTPGNNFFGSTER